MAIDFIDKLCFAGLKITVIVLNEQALRFGYLCDTNLQRYGHKNRCVRRGQVPNMTSIDQGH
jgi:hypothetical protein